MASTAGTQLHRILFFVHPNKAAGPNIPDFGVSDIGRSVPKYNPDPIVVFQGYRNTGTELLEVFAQTRW
ncbi:MAG: hypothetical protein FWG73_01650 [Planctomycetaceae bacterium]|nr:hypothetical protein [Planctomycetaceae bacterium]